MNESTHSQESCRLAALRRFAVAITVLNLVGHTALGFEQSWATPLAALAAAYFSELLLEWVAAACEARQPRFEGGLRRFVDFLLPSHITGLAVAMLLYPNERLGPVVFAASVGIASKTLIRVPVGGIPRHFLNPSNTGIAVTLLLFPWVGQAHPYMFTEELDGAGDLLLPLIIVLSGTFLNSRFTGRMPLIVGWLGGFVLQAYARSWINATPLTAALLPMTGVTFLLFTFYMVTDPGTTPSGVRAQLVFGVAVAAAYGILTAAHLVFGLFFGLLLVCAARGLILWLLSRASASPRRSHRRRRPVGVPVGLNPAMEGAK
jgi:Na+-translocating ferredoxin:NAD+ oxidoreductase RnfD subunit